MRIDNNPYVSRVQGVRGKAVYGAEGPAPASSDAVQLSEHAEDFRVAMQALAQLPAVREARVAELRAQVEQGTFQVDAEALTEKLFGQGR